ncbi:MAG: hypothetical protein IJX19_11545, partial [Clostridia bacterium]|nr:hypothetical protein [Clostridia bacterium]
MKEVFSLPRTPSLFQELSKRGIFYWECWCAWMKCGIRTSLEIWRNKQSPSHPERRKACNAAEVELLR